MRSDEIRAAIKARPDLQGLTSSEAIAAELSRGRVRVASRMLTERGILAEYPGGPMAAHELLTAIEKFCEKADQVLLAGICVRAVRFLRSPGGLDFGSPVTAALLDALLQVGVIDGPQRQHLRTMVEVPDPVTEYEVRVALWHDDGTPRS